MERACKIKTRAIIFASLKPGFIDIHVAYGYGMNDGGGLSRVARAKVPEDCRMPNTYVWVMLQGGTVIDIFKMTEEEKAENRIGNK